MKRSVPQPPGISTSARGLALLAVFGLLGPPVGAIALVLAGTVLQGRVGVSFSLSEAIDMLPALIAASYPFGGLPAWATGGAALWLVCRRGRASLWLLLVAATAAIALQLGLFQVHDALTYHPAAPPKPVAAYVDEYLLLMGTFLAAGLPATMVCHALARHWRLL